MVGIPLAINEEWDGAPIAHLFLHLSFLLCFVFALPSCSDARGADEEIDGHREGEGAPGGAQLTTSQEGARPSLQAHRIPRHGPSRS